MGLNFGYLLYFKRENLWDALLGFVSMAEQFDPPTRIHFPEQIIEIPLEAVTSTKSDCNYDDSEFEFFTCINFEEDPTLVEILEPKDQENIKRSPPDKNKHSIIPLCEIRLTVHQNLPEDLKNDYVLFEFDTVGTWMSLLFEKSTSIRNKFLTFLKENGGISCVFNYEFGGGEIIWHKGKHYKIHIEDQFILPNEIDLLIN